MVKKVLFCVLLSCAARAAKAESWDFRVRLTLDLDGPMHDRAQSLLSRKLRSLGDVSIVETGPSFELRVVGMEAKSVADKSLGYAFAFQVGLRLSTDAEREYPGVLNVAIGDLDSDCENIITALDTYLETFRKALREGSIKKSTLDPAPNGVTKRVAK